jgi:hypothetical protein
MSEVVVGLRWRLSPGPGWLIFANRRPLLFADSSSRRKAAKKSAPAVDPLSRSAKPARS